MPATHVRALPPPSAPIPRTTPGGARSSGGNRRARNPNDEAEENPRRRRRRRRNPQKNPPSTFGLIMIGLAATAVGYFGYREIRKRRMQMMLSAEQVLSPGRTLADMLALGTPKVGSITQPIAMTITPIAGHTGYAVVSEIVVHAPGTLSAPEPVKLENVEFGSDAGGGFNDLAYAGRTLDGTEFNGVAPPSSDKALGALVVNVTPQFALALYEAFSKAMAKGTIKWSDGATRDDTIKKVLQNVAPKTDWSKGLEPYAYGGTESTVWNAALLMGTIADQSYWNRRLLEEEG
jgi:hypothetical protein